MPSLSTIHLTAPAFSTANLVRRLLALSWRYRAECLKVLICQTVLLALGLLGLGLLGVGIDFIQHAKRTCSRFRSW